MSVTFFLASQEVAYPSCPTCKGRMNNDPAPDRECPHPACVGYGPEPIESTPSLNLSNANAHAFLRDVLGYDEVDPHGGELDAADVKLRLAMAPHRVDLAVRATERDGNTISFGLPSDRIRYYIERLGTIAEIATRRREPIHYG